MSFVHYNQQTITVFLNVAMLCCTQVLIAPLTRLGVGHFELLDSEQRALPFKDENGQTLTQNGKPIIKGILSLDRDGPIPRLVGRDPMDVYALHHQLKQAAGIKLSVNSHVQCAKPVSTDYEPTVGIEISTLIPIINNVVQVHMWKEKKEPNVDEQRVVFDKDFQLIYLNRYVYDYHGNNL